MKTVDRVNAIDKVRCRRRHAIRNLGVQISPIGGRRTVR